LISRCTEIFAMHREILEKLHDIRNQLPYLPQALRMVLDAAGKWTAAWAVLLVLQGVLPVASVYLTRAVVNSLVFAQKTGPSWAVIKPVILLVLGIALVQLLSTALGSLGSWVRTAQSELVQDHISDLIHKKSIELDLGFYETQDYYDQLHRARVDAMNMPLALMENMGVLMQNVITLVAMVAVLVHYGLWIPMVLVISTLPALFVVLRYTIEFNQWRLKNTMAVRRTYYYDWMVTERANAAEIRLFNLGDYFRHAFQEMRKRLRHERLDLVRRQGIAQMMAGGFGLLSIGAATAWMMWHAILGLITLGDVALFYQAFSQGQGMMRSLLNNAGNMVRNILFLENLFEFLTLEPKVTEPDRPVRPAWHKSPAIQLQDVTFRYPGSKRVTLEDFSLDIAAGKITALVGENGSGKSTIIKLICRFYDPEKGLILIDGTDIRTISLESLRKSITILFQEPVHYQATAAENIGVSALSNHDRTAIEAAARAAGADVPIQRLPDGYETMLGKWFGGSELSGGEWQRVALARAFLRRSPMVILDEPTSAMDTWAEMDWLSRFRELVSNRTALVVTHRFTTARYADVIHVMSDGRIVESGSHDSLLSENGCYASAWLKQMGQGANYERKGA